MTKTDHQTQSIYQRGIRWSNLKIEKVKHEKKIKMLEESEYSFRPKIEPLNCKWKMLNESNKKNMFQDLSIVSFFGRQETARKVRTSREKKISHRNYSAEQVNLTQKISSKGITKVMLNRYKELLHKELTNSMIKDEDTEIN